MMAVGCFGEHPPGRVVAHGDRRFRTHRLSKTATRVVWEVRPKACAPPYRNPRHAHNNINNRMHT